MLRRTSFAHANVLNWKDYLVEKSQKQTGINSHLTTSSRARVLST